MNCSDASDDQILQWGFLLRSGYNSDPIKYFQMSPFFWTPFIWIKHTQHFLGFLAHLDKKKLKIFHQYHPQLPLTGAINGHLPTTKVSLNRSWSATEKLWLKLICENRWVKLTMVQWTGTNIHRGRGGQYPKVMMIAAFFQPFHNV